MLKYLSLFLIVFSSSTLFAQSYSQSSGNKCSAYTYREYIFTDTPETPVPAQLDVAWLYCGGDDFGNSGSLNIDIWIDGNWIDLFNASNSGNGCQWVNSSTTIGVTTLNDAINSSGGTVLIRGRITDGCPGGVGCSSYSDPCYNATLSYDYAPNASFTVNTTATCVGGEAVFSNLSSGPQETWTWNFGEGAQPETAMGVGPHAVVWNSAGTKTVTLEVFGNGEISSTTSTDYVEVGNTSNSILFGDAFEVWKTPMNGLDITPTHILTGSDNAVYMVGTYSGPIDEDIWAAKVSMSGELIWFEKYESVGTDKEVEDFKLDDQNNLFIAASKNADYLTVKVLSSGELDWMSTFNGAGNGLDKAYALDMDESGNVYVVGVAAQGNSKMTTVKYDSEGNYLFQMDLVGNGNITGKDIVYKDGNVYILSSGRNESINDDIILEKYETQLGLIQWSVEYNGTGFGDDTAMSLINHDNDLFLLGETDQGTYNGYALVKYDLEGNFSWEQDYFNNALQLSEVDFFTKDTSGNLYIGGTVTTGSKLVKVAGFNGTEVWSSTFTGINETKFNNISVSPSGEVFLLSSTVNNAGDWDLAISEYDELGNEMWWGVYDGCGSLDDYAADLTHTNAAGEVIIVGSNIQAITLRYGALVEPLAAIATSSNEECVDNTFIFSDSSEGSALDYTWDFGADATPPNATGPGDHEVSYSTSGPKTVTLFISNTLGDSEITEDIVIHALPEVSVNAVESAVCSGESVIITAESEVSIEWNNDLGTNSEIEVSPLETTIYEATVIDSNNCSASDFIEITVNEVPTANAGEDVEVCFGGEVTLEGDGGNSYDWIGLGDSQTLTFVPSQSGEITLEVSLENGCSDQDVVNITVNSLPIGNAGADVSICTGESTVLNAVGGETYVWNNGLGETQSVEVMPFDDVTYVVTIIGLNGCEIEDDVIVTVETSPAANAGADQTTCSGVSVTLTGSGGSTYEWNNGLADEQSVEVSPEETTTYELTAIAENGCENTDEVIVNVYEIVEVSFTGLTESVYCSDDNGEYILVGTPDGGFFSGPGVSGGDLFSPDEAGLGDHTVVYEYEDENGCEYSVDQDLTVEICESINEINEFVLGVYPNPTSDILKVELDPAILSSVEFKLFDSTGKLIQVKPEMNGKTAVFNLSNNAAGNYVLFVTSSGYSKGYDIILTN